MFQGDTCRRRGLRPRSVRRAFPHFEAIDIKTGKFRLVSASMLGHGSNLRMTLFGMTAMGGSAGCRNSWLGPWPNKCAEDRSRRTGWNFLKRIGSSYHGCLLQMTIRWSHWNLSGIEGTRWHPGPFHMPIEDHLCSTGTWNKQAPHTGKTDGSCFRPPTSPESRPGADGTLMNG